MELMVRPANGGHRHLRWRSALGQSECEGNLITRLDVRVGAHAYTVQRQVIDHTNITDRFSKPPSSSQQGKGTAEGRGDVNSGVSPNFISCHLRLLNRLHEHPPREGHSISQGGFRELFLHFMYGSSLQRHTMMVRHGTFSHPWRNGFGSVSPDSSNDARPDEYFRPGQESQGKKPCFLEQPGLHAPTDARYLAVGVGLLPSQNLWRGLSSSSEPCGRCDGHNLPGNWADRN